MNAPPKFPNAPILSAAYLQMDVVLGDGAAEIDFCVLPKSPKCREQYCGLPEADRVKRRLNHRGRLTDTVLMRRLMKANSLGFGVFFCTAEIQREGPKEGEYGGSAVRRA